MNIQRGRDHGLADYNTVRAAYGLRRVTSFSQITKDPVLQEKLKELYGNVNNIDPWVGLLAEDHVKGGSVGPTLRAIIVDQFTRLRAADRFWYTRVFSGQQLRDIQATTLSALIRRNTDLTTIQPNAFFFHAHVAGQVFADLNHDGRFNGRDRGIAGQIVQLIELDSGEVVATTTTDARGRYDFGVDDGITTGRYAVRQVLPPGAVPTTPPRVIQIVSGDTSIIHLDLGSILGPPPGGPPEQP